MTVVRPLEVECERTIIAAAHTLGYMVHGSRPAASQKGWRTPLKGDKGFPDLVIAGHGRKFFVELKRKPNRIEPDQLRWHDVLGTLIVYVPEEQQAFIDLLARAASKARTATNPVAARRRKMVGFAEACADLDIAVSTGYGLAKDGRFPVPLHRIGGVWKIARADLERITDPGDVA
ncbi:MAG: hypothetical protein M3445_10025 [Actinomycetota bacterium]|nr:hypothetical protein [Actinomycetota bacterium]